MYENKYSNANPYPFELLGVAGKTLFPEKEFRVHENNSDQQSHSTFVFVHCVSALEEVCAINGTLFSNNQQSLQLRSFSTMSSPDALKWANQTVTLIDIYGDINNFTLSDFDDFLHSQGRSLIIFGVDIGMCAIVAIVSLLLTKPEKRHTKVFALNFIGCTLQFIRMLLAAITYNGPDHCIDVDILGANVAPASLVSVDIYIFATILWYIVIETSLLFQIRVVFCTEATAQKYSTCALGFLGLATIGFVTTDQIGDFIANLHGTSSPAFLDLVEFIGRVLFAIFVSISSTMFVANLIYLMIRRSKEGISGFGPLQVISIMASQCLIFPRISPNQEHESSLLVIFVIADFYVNTDGFVTIGQTFLTCSLPLSALWATSEAEKSFVIQPELTAGSTISYPVAAVPCLFPADVEKGVNNWSSPVVVKAW